MITYYHVSPNNIQIGDYLKKSYKNNNSLIQKMQLSLNNSNIITFIKNTNEGYHGEYKETLLKNAVEVIMDEYRKKYFPSGKSRIDSLFLYKSMEEAIDFNSRWHKNQALIYTVNVPNGTQKYNFSFFNYICSEMKRFFISENVCVTDVISKIEQWAYCYYSGANCHDEHQENIEYLCDDSVAIITGMVDKLF